ncbi:hypothetical protein FQZ97_767880 [compost metagenome]
MRVTVDLAGPWIDVHQGKAIQVMDENRIRRRLEDRTITGLGIQTLQLGGSPYREDAQDRLHPAAILHGPATTCRNQPQRPAIAGEQRITGIAVDAKGGQHVVTRVTFEQPAVDKVEGLVEHRLAGRTRQLVGDVAVQLARVVQRQGRKTQRHAVVDATDEGEIGVQRACHIVRDGFEHRLAGGGADAQGDMPQRLLDAFALADVGGDAAHGDDPPLLVVQGELARQIDPGAILQDQLLLELDGMTEAGHTQVVVAQGIGDGGGEQLVIAAPQYLLGGQLEEALEGAVDQPIAALQVLDVDHRAAVIDDLP